MQRVVALERNYDVTIGVPTVFGEVLLDGFREHPGDAQLIAGHPVVVSRPQRHDVVVGGEQPATGQLTNVVLAFAFQGLRHLLRDDVAAEHACEGVSHQGFQASIEAFNPTHGTHALLRTMCFRIDPIGIRALRHDPR
ncbi:hypothetical protein AMETH_0065 [Amycolatopsis methanolica 239]|uniref:Uncharacterized protein n=1 Tax=Amycolatopsis methanolica 239 TaxID=1068978 RepID=A0A076MQZ2_AMYME|nr:hypothetical protein AMETH_0065 [Amycolatopsis methanolica 239]